MAFANAGKFGNEQRERLNARSILSERRRQRRQRHKTNFKLEPLDPASARAHYRDLLIVANKRGEPIARHPDETPSEYQRRLQSLATELSVRDGEQPGEIIVGELTRAYIPERYGKKSVKPGQSSYLRKWMPDFIKRLRHKKFLKQGKGQNKR